LINIKNHESIEIDGKFRLPKDAIPDLKPILETTPQVSMLKLTKQIAEIESKKQSRSQWPQIDAFTTYTHEVESTPNNQQEIKKQWVIGLKLKIDLADGRESKSESLAQKKLAEEAEFKGQQASLFAEASIHELQHDLTLLHELLKNYDKTLGLSQQFSNQVFDEYTHGVKNSSDVISAAAKDLEQRKKYLQLFREYYHARSEILAYTDL
jgi:outer membrane protein TolC